MGRHPIKFYNTYTKSNGTAYKDILIINKLTHRFNTKNDEGTKSPVILFSGKIQVEGYSNEEYNLDHVCVKKYKIETHFQGKCGKMDKGEEVYCKPFLNRFCSSANKCEYERDRKDKNDTKNKAYDGAALEKLCARKNHAAGEERICTAELENSEIYQNGFIRLKSPSIEIFEKNVI